MNAILMLPATEDHSFLANLVDRPFLQHVVEFMAGEGIRKILVVGPAIDQARTVLGAGSRWDTSITYRNRLSLSPDDRSEIVSGRTCLLASAMCLPTFSLKGQSEYASGAIIHGIRGWTGWALVEPEDFASMPPLGCHETALSYLRGLKNYSVLAATLEFRCDTAENLWNAHRDAQASNLSGIFHEGLEVMPGVWVGRNASVSASASITAPVYIGQNSWIGPRTQIGPFAVVAKDCLVAPHTIARHAVIAPGTYVGSNLELDHVFVNKSRLFDLRLGASLDSVDSSILDGVFDFHWSAIPRQAWGAIISALNLCLRAPLILFNFNRTSRSVEAPGTPTVTADALRSRLANHDDPKVEARSRPAGL